MEILLIILVAAAAVLFIPVGSILGILAFKNLKQQALRIHLLSMKIEALQQRLALSEQRAQSGLAASPAQDEQAVNANAATLDASNSAAQADGALPSAPAIPEPSPPLSPESSTNSALDAIPPSRLAAARETHGQESRPLSAPTPKPSLFSRALQSLKENWMVWLGGLSVALAGIFMVHYSVSEGLMGPVLQLLLALAVGGGLHGGAEYLRRRHGHSDQIFAALAGGGSVTLYAALLAGIHHYYVIGPVLGLILLAAVSLGTMVLARLHGPLLALMGLSGAYLVPLLIDGDIGSVTFVLSYSLLITISSLLLMRYVFRNWLWYATLVGALLWWLAAFLSDGLVSGEALGGQLLPIYLTALWLSFAFLPRWVKDQGANKGSAPQCDAFIALLLAWGLSMVGQSADSSLFLSWLLILPAACLIPQSCRALWYLPWGAVLASAGGWLGYSVGGGLDSLYLAQFLPAQQADFSRYLILAALITTTLGFWQWRLSDKARWASLTLLSPLVWVLLGWLLLHGGTSDQSTPSIDWALGTLLLGTLYGALTWLLDNRAQHRSGQVWATLAAHLSYSLAVTMALREASLTLALAAQLISLVWLARRFTMPPLYLLVKVLLAVIVVRLTLNPWLASYDGASSQMNSYISTHWSLWTYGGSTLFAVLATRLADRQHAIRPWLEAASLHLLVLFLGAELRYWLYDGDIFSQQYSFTEACINTLLWGGLSITYMNRAQAAEQLAWLYRGCARVLLGLAGVSYLALITWYNPWWGETDIGAAPIFNMLLLAYGGPVLLALAFSRLPQLMPRIVALSVAGAAFMLFTALEIRQLWQGSDMALWYGMGNGELYSYSVVGMGYAILAIIYASKQAMAGFYKVGMVLLGLVIAKIFLIDMDGLQGLWRVAAFMGLGLALLGLAWMHQKVQHGSALKAVSEASAD